MLVKDVLAFIKQDIVLTEATVDTLKYGDGLTVVKGIAVMFMPTLSALKEAVNKGCNMVLTHEGLYYSHWDQHPSTDALMLEKEAFIKSHDLQIFRFHDYIHQYQPDLITHGLVQALGWEDQLVEAHRETSIIELPDQRPLIEHLNEIKRKLGLGKLRYVGAPEQLVSRIAIFVGFRGNGATVIPAMTVHDCDTVIYGEGYEWETPEYIRDTQETNNIKAAIILGHRESETPGMRFFARLLQQQFPALTVAYIDAPSPFDFL